jgi:methylenetetrahydrofolate dehydrogenase (NADP+) / methenyltetrahydrofolate cyclohydrolase
MSGTIIDGKARAAKLRETLALEITELKAKTGLVPGLAVVLVGEDPASRVYVRNKAEQTREVGMKSLEFKLSEDTPEQEVLALVERLNADPEVHGILVQLPLPKHIDSAKVLLAINPDKDVDGFHAVNVGRLWIGDKKALVPCTPTGSMILLKDTLGNLSGLNAVVVGRSNIVGKPMAALLLAESCTVTIAHSKTKDIASVVRQADIVVAAVGVPEMVRGAWIKPGATIIDVGINRVPGENGKTKLVGDCHYEECAAVAGAITPVPGGVGPMTIACLLLNTVVAFKNQHNL